MCTELDDDLSIPLPKDWSHTIRSAVLNIIGLLRIGMLTGREFLIREGDANQAKIHRLETEVAMLNEELRINGARMERIDPHRRPHYLPTERMAILELRTRRGWNNAETARHFFVSDETIRTWLRRARRHTGSGFHFTLWAVTDLVFRIVAASRLATPKMPSRLSRTRRRMLLTAEALMPP